MLLFVLAATGGLTALFAASAPSATRVKVGDNYFVRASGVPTLETDVVLDTPEQRRDVAQRTVAFAEALRD